MKAKARKINSYPGCKVIAIDVTDDSGRTVTAFTVSRNRSWYEHDSKNVQFNNLTDAKNYALTDEQNRHGDKSPN